MLALRRDLASHQRHASAYAEREYQRAQQHYQQQAHEQATAAHTFALAADGRAALKKLYREAARLCHPDRVADVQKAAATAAFQ